MAELLLPDILLAAVIAGTAFLFAAPKHLPKACSICALAIVPLLLAAFIVGVLGAALQALLTMFVCLICQALETRARTTRICILTVAVLCFAIPFASVRSRLQWVEQLRQQHAFESIAGRLEYETRSQPDLAAHPALAVPVENRLKERESRRESNSRRRALEALHDQTNNEFVQARGFGAGRMLGYSLGQLRLPEEARVSLPTAPEPPYQPAVKPHEVSEPPLAGRAEPPPASHGPGPAKEVLLTLHDGGLEDFVDADRMGYVKSREQVAGFVSHRLSVFPELPQKDKTAAPSWRVGRLELIGLLKHPTPVAYVSEHLPRMDQLKDAATRPLDAFEAAAVSKLKNEEDLVVKEGTNRIRMVGSIRASKNCLECHSVSRGTLLGAFSYELLRTQPVAVPVDRSAEPPRPKT